MGNLTRTQWFLNLSIILTELFVITTATDSCKPTITLSDGMISGTTTRLFLATQTVNKYLGIPYAESPPARFSPPVPPQKWNVTRDASQFGPQCFQQSTSLTPFAPMDPTIQSEDCLYLNVFQPGSSAPGNGWPVMLWIHGGGLVFGSGSLSVYDGSRFAAYEDVILITFNYRLGVFGFPGAPDVPNIGFLDQRLAIQWVQDNIQKFGGDPAKVTIFGESSGSISVDAILTAPQQIQGFQAAIMQSGTVLSNNLASLGVNNAAAWNNLTKHFGCNSLDTLDCIRDVPAANLSAYTSIVSFPVAVVNDNITYTSKSGEQRRAGKAANVPVLVGSTADDGTIFTYGMTNLTAYINDLFGALPSIIPNVTQAYAVGSPGIANETQAIGKIFTDIGLQCPTAVLVNQTTSAGAFTYRYLYNATFPNIMPVPNLGAFHSSELSIVFSTYNTSSALAQEYALSNYMRGTWAQFARNPNAGPGWGPVGFGPFEGKDIAVIGNDGSAGVTLVTSQEIDGKCELYESIYSLLS